MFSLGRPSVSTGAKKRIDVKLEHVSIVEKMENLK